MAAGQLVCVVGPSGCGKTTLLRCLGGLLAPTAGDGPGRRRAASPDRPTASRSCSRSTGEACFPWLRVQRERRTAAEGQGPAPRATRRRSWPRRSTRSVSPTRRVPTRGSCPAACSSAWRSPARWRSSRAVLLMDEPFAAVDAQTRADLEDLIRSVWQRLGVTLLFVTHDIDEAVYLGQRVIVLSAAPTVVAEDLRDRPAGRARPAHHPRRSTLPGAARPHLRPHPEGQARDDRSPTSPRPRGRQACQHRHSVGHRRLARPSLQWRLDLRHGGDIAIVEPATGSRARADRGGRRARTWPGPRRSPQRPSRTGRPPTSRNGRRCCAAPGISSTSTRPRSSSWMIRETGAIDGLCAFAVGVAAQECYEAAALASRPLGEILPSNQPRLSLLRRVPVGVVGVISPVQRAADPLHPVGRAGAGAGQRGGPQAGPAHADRGRLHPGPGLRGGRAARRVCCTCCRAAPRRARRWSTDPRIRVVSFTGSTATGRKVARAGRPPPQAGAPRAGRQLGAGDPGRRRPRARRLGRRLGVVPASGTDLHDGRAGTSCTRASPTTMSRRSPSTPITCRSATRPPARWRSAR